MNNATPNVPCLIANYVMGKVYESIGTIPPAISASVYLDLQREADRIAAETPINSVVRWKNARDFIVNKYSL